MQLDSHSMLKFLYMYMYVMYILLSNKLHVHVRSVPSNLNFVFEIPGALSLICYVRYKYKERFALGSFLPLLS